MSDSSNCGKRCPNCQQIVNSGEVRFVSDDGLIICWQYDATPARTGLKKFLLGYRPSESMRICGTFGYGKTKLLPLRGLSLRYFSLLGRKSIEP